MQDTNEGKDVYSRITAQIVEHLEKGVRPLIRDLSTGRRHQAAARIGLRWKIHEKNKAT